MNNDKWMAYRITLKLLSPMHIGWRKVGNLQQTRLYVPARTMWGALTARLTRETGTQDYKEIGRQVSGGFRFSYFYFTDQAETDLNCINSTGGWPWSVGDHEKGNTGLFDWRFLNSYASSPITKQQVTEEGGLHETEHIMPFTREGKQVYLTGWVFEHNALSQNISNWQEILSRIQLGSERSYGWGRVSLVADPEEKHEMFGAELELKNDDPEVIIPENAFITSHASLSNENFIGKAEMLAGRLTSDASRYGHDFAPLMPCWVPGTLVTKEKRFAIGPDGIWNQCKY